MLRKDEIVSGCGTQYRDALPNFDVLMAPQGSAKKSPPSHVDIVPRPWNLGSGLGSCVTGRDETRLEHVYTVFPPACPDGPVDTSSRYPPFLPLRLRFTPASLQNEADQHHNEW